MSTPALALDKGAMQAVKARAAAIRLRVMVVGQDIAKALEGHCSRSLNISIIMVYKADSVPGRSYSHVCPGESAKSARNSTLGARKSRADAAWNLFTNCCSNRGMMDVES